MDMLPAPEQPELRKVRGGRLIPRKMLCQGPCQRALTTVDFDKDTSKPSGFKAWCKQCRSAKRELEEERRTASQIENMDAAMLARLEDAPFGGTTLPHQTQALEALMQRVGGIEGFATLYIANMLAAPPGSQARSRMLDKILQAIQLCSDDAKVAKPRHLMSDAELEASVKQRLAKLQIAPETVIEADDVRESA